MKTLALFAFLVLTTGALAAERAPSRNGSAVLINKDVNGERWAITFDQGRRSVTGNVLLPNGGAAFIDCDANVAGASVQLGCYTWNDVSWLFLASVSLPTSFFGISDGPTTCAEYPRLLYLTYGDSCGVRAESDLDFDEKNGCVASGPVYNSTDPSIEGMLVSVTIDAANNMAVRFTYRGACQGEATGTGRITGQGADWRVDGTVTGSTTCCGNLSGTFAIHR